MKTTIITTLASILLLTSCQKDFSAEYGLAQNNPTTIGNTTTNVAADNCKECGYIPTCNGSVFNYKTQRGGLQIGTSGSASSYTLTYISDTTIGGKLYKKMKGDAQQITYINCSTGNSTQLYVNPQSNTQISVYKITQLKANEPVGTTWKDINTLGNNLSEYSYYKIEAKGTTKTVFGKVYNDVIKVRLDVKSEITGVAQEQSTYTEMYYAKGVGLIESIDYNFSDRSVLSNRVLTSAIIP